MNPNPLHQLVAALTAGRRKLTADEYRHVKYHFSQNGEDLVVRSLFPDPAYRGFYVDVGAHDPIRFSNTALLAKRGWRGINIDPLPSSHAAFRRARPGDINLCMGIAAEPGTLHYLMHREPAFNRLDLPELQGVVVGNVPPPIKRIPIEVDSLASVLGRHLPPGQSIDFLNVDCEGFDEIVLRSNDWDRFRPKAVCVEDWVDLPTSPLVSFMASHGYRQVAQLCKSRVFVTDSAAAAVPHPAATLDGAAAVADDAPRPIQAHRSPAPPQRDAPRVADAPRPIPAPVPDAGVLARVRRFNRAIRQSIRNYRTLSVGLGQFRSMRERRPCSGSGRPLPWLTYPAIQYLEQLDLSRKRLFEFGCGDSTLFWAARCRGVTSVEDNPDWHARIAPMLPSNATCLLRSGGAYPRSVLEAGHEYDVIVIDGTTRRSCAECAVERLSETGFIVLDDADWLPNTTALLRGKGLLQVDMSGFAPIIGYCRTTSFFFRRSADVESVGERWPATPPGGLPDCDPTADT